MMKSTEHKLVGLEPDNWLAFLALLGLLRSLETARPEWRPRVSWDVDRPPTRPVLVIQQAAALHEIADYAAAGCEQLAEHYDFGGAKDLNWSQEEARELLTSAVNGKTLNRDRADLLSALISDAAVKDNGMVIPTPLCLLFGQGHQHFLERLASVPRQASAPPRGNRKNPVTFTPSETLAAALFRPWERVDATQSFRWDPAEDRRYALRFDNPSNDKALTVHGANRLAAIAVPLFTVVPHSFRGRVRLKMVGASFHGGQHHFTWPIWKKPASLAHIRAWLTHPVLAQREIERTSLNALGIHAVHRAARISVGKFANVTRAALVTSAQKM